MAGHRRAHWKAATIAVAVVVLLAAQAAQAAQAAPAIPQAAVPELRTAPLNPAFVLWQAMGDLQPVLDVASPHGLGQVPSPVIGYAGPATPGSSGAVGAYPATYDLRTLGRLTAVRNQGALGTCWTFGSTGSLESSSLPGETLDLSEDNMALTSGFNVGGATTAAQKYSAGGNADMATAYFVRWGGPVQEAGDAYGDSVTPAGLTAVRHVQNVDMWSGRASATDNDRIKYAVTTYGGVDVSMLWADASYNAAKTAYNYTGTGHPNHDVLVVGWDDGYAAANFSPAAAGNGAFIVRNSWGGGWGSAGYFYVSYYDTRFARVYNQAGTDYANNAYTFEAAQPAANYGSIHQHDPLGVTGYIGYGAGTPTWGAAVYTASAASMLNAVGFYALAPDTAYEVWAGPALTSLTRLTSGTMAQMGYHTVAMPEGTTLTGGASFVVAVKLTTPGWEWPIATEEPIADYSSAATAAAGQTYYGSNGSTWYDMRANTANASVCLKAYTSRIPTTACTYSFSPSATSGWKNTAQTVTLTGSAGDGATRMIYFSQDGGSTWGHSLDSSVNMSVSTDGAHSIKYYSSDSLAIEATHSPGYVNIDTTRPSTTDNHLSVTLNDPVTVTLTPSDATSGVAKTEYKVDTAATYTSGTSVALTAGTHTVAYRSTDNAGNVEADKTFTVTVAARAPVSQSSYSTFAADAVSGWKTGTQSVTVTATAGIGTGLTIYTSQDGGATWTPTVGATATLSVSAQGAHQIKYYAEDSLTTEAIHTAGWINIDSVAPVTTDDHPDSAVTPLTVTLSPTDATSGMTGGLAKTEYKVDGAAAYTTGTSVVLGQGAHTVVYRSTDRAGNRETPDKSFSVTVIGPTSPLSACDYTFAPDALSNWTALPQMFTITAAGGVGTGRTIHYSLDGGAAWSTSTEAGVDVPVSTEGAHHVQYYVMDSLASEGLHDAGWINIDSGKPWTTAARASVRKGAKVTLKYRASDPAPGCGKATLKLQIRLRTKVVKTVALGSRATNVPLSYRYTARLKAGTYTWRVLATDLAGNVAVKTTSARLVVR